MLCPVDSIIVLLWKTPRFIKERKDPYRSQKGALVSQGSCQQRLDEVKNAAFFWTLFLDRRQRNPPGPNSECSARSVPYEEAFLCALLWPGGNWPVSASVSSSSDVCGYSYEYEKKIIVVYRSGDLVRISIVINTLSCNRSSSRLYLIHPRKNLTQRLAMHPKER